MSKLCTNSVLSKPVSLEDIKSTLDEQNKILTQQKITIDNLRNQNKNLEKLIETYKNEYNDYDNEELYSNSEQNIEWAFDFSYRTAYRSGDWVSSISNSNNEESISTLNVEEPQFWMNGAAISVRSPWLPNTSFIFTGLYGNSRSDVTYIKTIPRQEDFPKIDSVAITANGGVGSSLIDIEFLARTSIENTNANWTVGFQYIQYDFTTTLSSNSIFFPPEQAVQKTKQQYFLPKVGLGGYFELAENHRFFSNSLFTLGYGKFAGFGISEDQFLVGVDINVGYQWLISRNFSLSPRYRFQGLYVSSKENLIFRDQFFIIHGPELNLTYHF
jgi:hypothetical protein